MYGRADVNTGDDHVKPEKPSPDCGRVRVREVKHVIGLCVGVVVEMVESII